MRVPCGELTDILPNWEGIYHKSDPPSNFAALKSAAITVARASEEERRALIAEHSRAYCIVYESEQIRTERLFLLMRVLFVLPTRHPESDTQTFEDYCRPDGWFAGSERDLSWPVHEDPHRRVLEIDPNPGCYTAGYRRRYNAWAEYDYFRGRFPLRTPDELEALTIRARP